MPTKLNAISVFCGSSSGTNPIYKTEAEKLAHTLFEKDITLIYGGANIGLMGALANSLLDKGGSVIGVIPKSIVDLEIAHTKLTKLHIVDSMHERKALMENLSDGCILFPGGSGSLDEFFEMFTWSQLNLHTKPCGILNINNYYEHLIKLIAHANDEGFISNSHKDMIQIATSATTLLNQLESFKYKKTQKVAATN